VIRTEAEYQDALKRLEQDRQVISMQRSRLQELKLQESEVQRALEPALAFHEQLREEVETYERLKRGDIAPIESLNEIGRILIGLRIARGVTQRQLAERLQVSESQVSRDERNDYVGITVERAQRVIRALEGTVRLEAHVPLDGDLVAIA
jgi:DNA-directed RNA polymerase specialized sigma subunit